MERYVRKYNPVEVTIIDSTTRDLGYFLWLKSRQKIITDLNGKHFMKLMDPTEDWYDQLPQEFFVGDEKVDKFSYRSRINQMNLQYNNSEYFIFEIVGSCLFRDMLYNINKNAQWAESNRFLFSILDKDAVYDSKNYAISEEYKWIPEWEAQFDRYMEAIKADPIVDHNRLEMPYSISSRFWIGINKKCLVDLLSWMKFHAPFFYRVYGEIMQVQAKISKNELKDKVSPTISQYILKNASEVVEGCQEIYGTHIVTSKMGLILYSQFIRQSDTLIAGLFNELIHEDEEDFKHKVFKGNTTFMIKYVADESKVKHTVSNRLCAFAMSSGDDPCSWSYFLNRFLPDDLTPSMLLELLPCTWEGKTLCNCKFHDDIKFRNEGKEISNCPCPLVSRSMKDAEIKRDRDHNKVGDAYYETTKYLLSNE